MENPAKFADLLVNAPLRDFATPAPKNVNQGRYPVAPRRTGGNQKLQKSFCLGLSPFSEDCVLLSIPGTEALSPAIKYVIAFAIIFLLLALFALVLRRLTGGRLALPAHGRSRQPRLGIVDVYDLDRQRQLILLRRDNVEHLLLIGGPNDVVVETNIVRVVGARLPAPPSEAALERP